MNTQVGMQLLEEIALQQGNAKRINQGNSPHYVMLHPIKKDDLYAFVGSSSNLTLQDGAITKCFGMTVIWTVDIPEDKVICTYDLSGVR